MTGGLVLDAEAISALARENSPGNQEVRAAMTAAARLGKDVIVATVTLAELYRGHGHNQIVDSCLSRETGIATRDTDKEFARLVGGLLAGAGMESDNLADAHVVAAALEAGRCVVLTGDRDDIQALAAPYPNIIIRALPT
ncbi:MAG: type II toxin-antitoxin system VapC family toxin [Actinomycetota bacterium]